MWLYSWRFQISRKTKKETVLINPENEIVSPDIICTFSKQPSRGQKLCFLVWLKRSGMLFSKSGDDTACQKIINRRNCCPGRRRKYLVDSFSWQKVGMLRIWSAIGVAESFFPCHTRRQVFLQKRTGAWSGGESSWIQQLKRICIERSCCIKIQAGFDVGGELPAAPSSPNARTSWNSNGSLHFSSEQLTTYNNVFIWRGFHWMWVFRRRIFRMKQQEATFICEDCSEDFISHLKQRRTDETYELNRRQTIVWNPLECLKRNLQEKSRKYLRVCPGSIRSTQNRSEESCGDANVHTKVYPNGENVWQTLGKLCTNM